VITLRKLSPLNFLCQNFHKDLKPGSRLTISLWKLNERVPLVEFSQSDGVTMILKKLNQILKFLKELNKTLLYLDPEIPKSKIHKIKDSEKYAFTNSIREATDLSKKFLFDLVIFDPDFEEREILFDLIKKIKTQNKRTKIIAFSDEDDFDNVFRAYKTGIDLFIPKMNINPEYFKTVVELVLRNYSRIIISKNPELQKCYQLLSFYAKEINSDILLKGENGTGKGILARAIHLLGNYKGDFIVQNCAGIPDTLFESEMFGYEAGAFTGANKRGKTGVFEKANNGILFLDEIGDLPPDQQAKLLRAIQRKVILKVGSTKEKMIDVRYIYASNKDLYHAVRQNMFREDFYYRLKGAEIQIPPLRETPEDLEIMCAVFVNRFLKEQIKGEFSGSIHPDRDSFENLKKYDFPGNMRELQKIVYQSLIKMLMNNSSGLILEIDERESRSTQKERANVETFWQVIELMEKGHLRYGGLLDAMKRPVIQHLRTKYNDDRDRISKILGFKDKQSLSNEIYRLGKH